MNPLFNNKNFFKVYIIINLLFAMIYTFSIGLMTQIPINSIIIDFISAFILVGLTGIAIWNIVKYAITASENSIYKGFMNSSLVLFCIILVVGIETIIVYITHIEYYSLYATTIPIRVLIIALAFTIIIFYYSISICRENETKKGFQENTKKDQNSNVPQRDIEDHILVREGQKIKIIPIEEIKYIQSDGDYVAIVTPSGKWLKEQTMKYFEEHLPQNKFIRIHRSYIIGVSHIAKIERYGEQQLVTLRSGEKIRISTTGYRLLKERLGL